MHPVQVSKDACFTVRYSTKPEKIGSQDIDLSHQGQEYLLKTSDTEYKGPATPGKDVEAILIWDSTKNQYVLHFVNHNLRVSKVLKRSKQTPKPRVATPSVATPPLSKPDKEAPKIAVPTVSESQSSDESSASDADDFGDLANELEGELGTLESTATVIGTAGAGVDDEEISSEEE